MYDVETLLSVVQFMVVCTEWKCMEVWLYIMEVYGSVGAAVLQCAGLPPVSPLHPPHLCSYSIPWRCALLQHCRLGQTLQQT